MPTLLIVRGYGGTGKSTAAKAFARRKKWAFLEYDNFVWGFNSYRKPTKKIGTLALQSLLAVLRIYVHAKENVVVEGALAPRGKHDPLRIPKLTVLARRKGYRIRIVMFTVDEKTAKLRMKQRGHIVPPKVWHSLRAAHEKDKQPEEIVLNTTKQTLPTTLRSLQKIVSER